MIARSARGLVSPAPRRLAWLLLLAWLPVLLYVDHWPAPALLQPTSSLSAHPHPASPQDAAAHVEHGHAGDADGVAGTVVAPPAAAATTLVAPFLPQPAADAPPPASAVDRPEAPPPR